MRCDQCKHWRGPESDYSDDTLIIGTCLAVRERWEIQNAEFDGEGKKSRYDYDDWDEVERIEAAALRRSPAWVVDGSGYHAALITKPDFGCVQFEAKP